MGTHSELDPRRDEVERLLRQAHLEKMRGQSEQARATLQHALELMPDNPDVWEVLGDYRREAGDWKGAYEAYKRAHELIPENPHIERKFAESVLMLTRQQEQYRHWELALEGKADGDALLMPRNPGLAFLLSMLMPGVGQLYNGQWVKGGVLITLYVLGWIVFMLTPGGSDFLYNLLAYLVNTARVRGTLSTFQLFVGLMLFLVWIYSMIDAPLSAAARNRRIPGTE